MAYWILHGERSASHCVRSLPKTGREHGHYQGAQKLNSNEAGMSTSMKSKSSVTHHYPIEPDHSTEVIARLPWKIGAMPEEWWGINPRYSSSFL